MIYLQSVFPLHFVAFYFCIYTKFSTSAMCKLFSVILTFFLISGVSTRVQANWKCRWMEKHLMTLFSNLSHLPSRHLLYIRNSLSILNVLQMNYDIQVLVEMPY